MAHPTRIFKEPKDLEKAWEDYKANLIEQAKSWEKVQYVGRDGEKRTDYPKLPLTLEGFEVWYYQTYKHFIHQYFKNPDEVYNEFMPICSHVKKEIRADQIRGGLLGFYNPSITQRLNGLTEKQSIEHSGGINVPKVPDIGNRK